MTDCFIAPQQSILFVAKMPEPAVIRICRAKNSVADKEKNKHDCL
jgi:hypothetical protein